MPTLHVALDESGNLSFTPSGSKYYVFAAAWTYDPAPLAKGLADLRYGLLKAGHDLDSFHAAEDKQEHRDAVVSVITGHAGWKFAGLIVEKAKLNPSIREPEKFYPMFGAMVLGFVFKGCILPKTDRVIAFTDRLPVNRKKEAVAKTFKVACKNYLPSKPFELYHHPRQSNCWLQAVDYCAWSLSRKWELGDTRTYDTLKPRLEKQELDVFAKGDGHKYY